MRIIYMKHACHVCLKELESLFDLRRHISTIQNKSMPPKDTDGNKTKSLNGIIIITESAPIAVPYRVCLSLWTFHSGFESLKKHMAIHKTQSDVASISIKTRKCFVFFRNGSRALHQPRVPKAFIVRAKTTCKTAKCGQANIVSLKQYPTFYNMLNQALDVELSNLPRFLCSFAQPGNIATYPIILMKVILFVLADVCSEWHSHEYYQSSDHRQLLGFQWCEIPIKEHVEFTIDPYSWIRTATVKYHDGLSYDMNGYSRRIMIGGYKQTKVRHADVPNTFNNCVSWMEVFELMAYLFTFLQEQETIMQTIKKRKVVEGLVKYTDRALHISNEIKDRPIS
ncbi:uncharacterized protein EV154DRAFT_481862 [Mucor mucedo]|uniref:uncharacterized protein n=1 Tax=Mucor mucedo TaxID=29922 RepID=UPI00221EFA8D|nr:uncharacterized protein EV154DRAFT_481862 [Mucor mucedo]KAI7890736.1 hypothetical protein EV154DRAFT_481862 [Mucor mucedo]